MLGELAEDRVRRVADNVRDEGARVEEIADFSVAARGDVAAVRTMSARAGSLDNAPGAARRINDLADERLDREQALAAPARFLIPVGIGPGENVGFAALRLDRGHGATPEISIRSRGRSPYCFMMVTRTTCLSSRQATPFRASQHFSRLSASGALR